MVHVGAVDAPVTLADVKAIAAEVWRAVGGKETPRTASVDILGWEFAFELNELARQVAAEARVDMAFKKIPREVLEKKAVEQGDVQFFELGALSVEVKTSGCNVTLTLTDFVVPMDDIPEDARKAIRHWSQLVDYWEVDWDHKDDTFHNEWQNYRTRKDPTLQLAAEHTYEEPAQYTLAVKVIDLLGNDTTTTIQIEVK
jgi:adenine-specific DNA-methyltransferase